MLLFLDLLHGATVSLNAVSRLLHVSVALAPRRLLLQLSLSLALSQGCSNGLLLLELAGWLSRAHLFGENFTARWGFARIFLLSQLLDAFYDFDSVKADFYVEVLLKIHFSDVVHDLTIDSDILYRKNITKLFKLS